MVVPQCELFLGIDTRRPDADVEARQGGERTVLNVWVHTYGRSGEVLEVGKRSSVPTTPNDMGSRDTKVVNVRAARARIFVHDPMATHRKLC